MRYVYFDFETSMSKTVSLKKQTLRQYLAQTRVLGLAIALDDEEPVWFPLDEITPGFLEYLRELALSDDVCFVAHKASFDIRVLVLVFGLPYPTHWRCSLEAAMASWPNHPGGYGLDNLGRTLNVGDLRKTGKGDKVMRMTPEELARYCIMDTKLCRKVFQLANANLPESEQRIAEACSRVKEMYFEVDAAAVKLALEQFTAQANTYGHELALALEDDGDPMDPGTPSAVGIDDDGAVRSVKPAQVKRLLLEHLGFQTHTISEKKINPAILATNEAAKAAIAASSKANKALSHKRRVARFAGIDIIDAELNHYAAHTGRFASRASGKGLNLLNMPKHDKEVAKLVRQMYRLPKSHVFVRGDEANVEYRLECLLTGCQYGIKLFEADTFADPYSAFGGTCTGKVITKGMPARQFFKNAVLGLGYLMSVFRWASEILRAMSKPKPDFTLAELQGIVDDNGWHFPPGKFYSGMLLKLGCEPAVITLAFHSHRLFHDVHPEFRQLATWGMLLATEVSRGCTASTVDDFYTRADAPDRRLIDCRISDRFEGYTLETTICGWDYPTVYWRDLGVRDIPGYGPGLCFMHGKRGYRGLTKNITIENWVQSGARNRTCQAYLRMEECMPYLLNVHDELLPVVPADPECMHLARTALIDALGPDTTHDDGFPTWAVMINPAEINASRSFYELDVGTLDPRFPTNHQWWDALRTHPDLIESLP